MKKKNNFAAGVFTGIAIAIAAICICVQTLAVLSLAGMSAGGDFLKKYTLYEYDDDNEPEDADDDTGIASNDAIELFNNEVANISDLLSAYYLFDYDADSLLDSMLKGYVRGLGDKYSEYLTADELAEKEEQEAENVFGGIGASITYNDTNGHKSISRVQLGSPAQKGGLKVGDIIYKVDGVDVTGMTLDETVALVRGEVGEKVTLLVIREGERFELEFIREEIHNQIVSYEMYEDQTGYLSFSEFSDESEKQIREAILDMNSKGLKGLVVDVRYNGGGGVNNAVNIVNMFVEKGTRVTVLKDKNGNEDIYETKDDPICSVPVVIVVNGQSISAAELFAGAMRDLDRAVLVGEKTFGKGVAQNSFVLNDSSGQTVGLLKITTDYYYLPSGECINGIGITPEIIAEETVTEDGYDNQVMKAFDQLDILMKEKPAA